MSLHNASPLELFGPSQQSDFGSNLGFPEFFLKDQPEADFFGTIAGLPRRAWPTGPTGSIPWPELLRFLG